MVTQANQDWIAKHIEFGETLMKKDDEYEGFWCIFDRFFRIPFEYEDEGGCAFQCGKDLVHCGVWEVNSMPYEPLSVRRVNQKNKKQASNVSTNK